MERKTRRDLLKHAGTIGGGFLIAGCISESVPGDGPSGSPTPSPDSPEATDPATPEQPTGTVDVTPYSKLSDKGQRLFRQMHNEEPVHAPERDVPSTLWNANYVRYEGTVFAIVREPRGFASQTSLTANLTEESAIDDPAEVIAFPELTEEAQSVFTTVQTEGRYETRATLPNQLRDYRYVKYEADYYALMIAVADIRIWELAVSETNR